MSLVEESTFTTSEISFPNNSDSSTGNTSIVFEYFCYEVEADATQFNNHGPKIMILKQGLPMSICTTDSFGTL